MTDFWESVKGFRTSKAKEGESVDKRKWLEHFKNLLENEEEGGKGKSIEGRGDERKGEVEDELDRNKDGGGTKTLREMKNGKAAGEDGIATEFLKYLPRVWIREIAEVLDEIMNGEKLIKRWEMSRIYPIHKEGEEDKVKNCSRESVLGRGYNLLTLILVNTMRI